MLNFQLIPQNAHLLLIQDTFVQLKKRPISATSSAFFALFQKPPIDNQHITPIIILSVRF